MLQCPIVGVFRLGINARLRRSLGENSNLPVLSLVASLRGARDHMFRVVWQPFAISRGIAMKSLGGLESVLDLTRITFQPIFGGASDIIGRKMFLVLRELLVIAAMALFIFSGSWQILLLGVLFLGLSSAVGPIWSSLVAELAKPDELGRTHSILIALYTVTGLITPVAAGLLAMAYGYTSVFYLSVGLALICMLMVQLRLAETRRRREETPITLFKLVKTLADALRPPPYLRGFYLSMTVDSIVFGMGHRLLFGMLTKSYGYTPYMLSILTTAMMGAWAVTQIPLGRIVDRSGYRRFLAVSQSISCGTLALLLASKRLEVVLIAEAIIGISAGMWVPAEEAWIASNVPPDERGQAIASYSTFRGLLSFPAPFIGGVLYDAYGFDVPILLNLIGAVVDVVLIVLFVKEKVVQRS